MEGDGQFRQGVLPQAGGTGSCEVTTSSNNSVRTDSPDLMSQLTVDSNRYKFEKANFNAMVVEQKVPVRFPLISRHFFSWELDFAYVSLSPLFLPPSPVLSYLIYSCLVLSCRVLSCLFLPGLVTSVMFWPGRVFFDSNNPFNVLFASTHSIHCALIMCYHISRPLFILTYPFHYPTISQRK